ncbi:hypothetical protein [Paenibacillus radicis (ex Xue et al. 2023)]|uniref:Uncharacterized protein n=1 Tax=Paenibacillus radicis (ex Xue et al. 2023) TaxID=2972489 RepID=A0ABT1YQ55_9BACL|nr:hypothetical protein [Paenibacillus radicis (ex Xue et al. 2023)]MCR8635311.1 hypothetical protein [Paenibacillus radicis (ex Xue et al. 2023)]
MEKYKPMQMPMHHVPMPGPNMPAPNMPAPNMQMPVMQMPAPAPMPVHHYSAPINLHASYEEINIYEPKKQHHHGHCHKPAVGWTTTGTILVLYILLVIILRGTCK